MFSIELSTTHKLVLLVTLPVSGILLYLLLRNNDDEEEVGPRPKVTTTRSTVIELKVPQFAVGAIIGAKGANIKQIQDESGARVNMKDGEPRTDRNRTVLIRGTSEQAQRAEYLIHKIVADVPQKIEETIYVPLSAVGRIIGRQGQTIHEMSDVSKARIVVERASTQNKSDSRMVTITGTPEAITSAKMLIEEKVCEENTQRAKLAVSAANRPQRHKTTQRANGAAASLHPHQYGAGDNSSATSDQWRGTQGSRDIERTSGGASDECNVKIKSSYWPVRYEEGADVYVSSVATPSNFWVQIVCSESVQLDTLNESVTKYCSLQPKNHHPSWKIGDVVAAPFEEEDNNWYRAQVMEVLHDKVDLYFLDYGDSMYVDSSVLIPLSSQFAELEPQAHECCLDGIEPIDGNQWTEHAIDTLEDITHVAKWKVLVAQTVAVESSIRRVRLFDTNGSEDIDVAAELVKRGHARWKTTQPVDAVSATSGVEASEISSFTTEDKPLIFSIHPVAADPLYVCEEGGQMSVKMEFSKGICEKQGHQSSVKNDATGNQSAATDTSNSFFGSLFRLRNLLDFFFQSSEEKDKQKTSPVFNMDSESESEKDIGINGVDLKSHKTVDSVSNLKSIESEQLNSNIDVLPVNINDQKGKIDNEEVGKGEQNRPVQQKRVTLQVSRAAENWSVNEKLVNVGGDSTSITQLEEAFSNELEEIPEDISFENVPANVNDTLGGILVNKHGRHKKVGVAVAFRRGFEHEQLINEKPEELKTNLRNHSQSDSICSITNPIETIQFKQRAESVVQTNGNPDSIQTDYQLALITNGAATDINTGHTTDLSCSNPKENSSTGKSLKRAGLIKSNELPNQVEQLSTLTAEKRYNFESVHYTTEYDLNWNGNFANLLQDGEQNCSNDGFACCETLNRPFNKGFSDLETNRTENVNKKLDIPTECFNSNIENELQNVNENDQVLCCINETNPGTESDIRLDSNTNEGLGFTTELEYDQSIYPDKQETDYLGLPSKLTRITERVANRDSTCTDTYEKRGEFNNFSAGQPDLQNGIKCEKLNIVTLETKNNEATKHLENSVTGTESGVPHEDQRDIKTCVTSVDANVRGTHVVEKQTSAQSFENYSVQFETCSSSTDGTVFSCGNESQLNDTDSSGTFESRFQSEELVQCTLEQNETFTVFDNWNGQEGSACVDCEVTVELPPCVVSQVPFYTINMPENQGNVSISNSLIDSSSSSFAQSTNSVMDSASLYDSLTLETKAGSSEAPYSRDLSVQNVQISAASSSDTSQMPNKELRIFTSSADDYSNGDSGIQLSSKTGGNQTLDTSADGMVYDGDDTSSLYSNDSLDLSRDMVNVTSVKATCVPDTCLPDIVAMSGYTISPDREDTNENYGHPKQTRSEIKPTVTRQTISPPESLMYVAHEFQPCVGANKVKLTMDEQTIKQLFRQQSTQLGGSEALQSNNRHITPRHMEFSGQMDVTPSYHVCARNTNTLDRENNDQPRPECCNLHSSNNMVLALQTKQTGALGEKGNSDTAHIQLTTENGQTEKSITANISIEEVDNDSLYSGDSLCEDDLSDTGAVSNLPENGFVNMYEDGNSPTLETKAWNVTNHPAVDAELVSKSSYSASCVPGGPETKRVQNKNGNGSRTRPTLFVDSVHAKMRNLFQPTLIQTELGANNHNTENVQSVSIGSGIDSTGYESCTSDLRPQGYLKELFHESEVEQGSDMLEQSGCSCNEWNSGYMHDSLEEEHLLKLCDKVIKTLPLTQPRVDNEIVVAPQTVFESNNAPDTECETHQSCNIWEESHKNTCLPHRVETSLHLQDSLEESWNENEEAQSLITNAYFLNNTDAPTPVVKPERQLFHFADLGFGCLMDTRRTSEHAFQEQTNIYDDVLTSRNERGTKGTVSTEQTRSNTICANINEPLPEQESNHNTNLDDTSDSVFEQSCSHIANLSLICDQDTSLQTSEHLEDSIENEKLQSILEGSLHFIDDELSLVHVRRCSTPVESNLNNNNSDVIAQNGNTPLKSILCKNRVYKQNATITDAAQLKKRVHFSTPLISSEFERSESESGSDEEYIGGASYDLVNNLYHNVPTGRAILADFDEDVTEF